MSKLLKTREGKILQDGLEKMAGIYKTTGELGTEILCVGFNIIDDNNIVITLNDDLADTLCMDDQGKLYRHYYSNTTSYDCPKALLKDLEKKLIYEQGDITEKVA